jgi:DNA-binding IclR family transcriptional regulator
MSELGEVRSGSQAVERALAVLDCFAARPELTLSEVAYRTELPVSTTYRIMQALVRGRFLERDDGEAYHIGGHVADLVPRRSVADEAAPHLYALAAGIKITVSFGVLDDGKLDTLVSARPPVRYCAAQIPSEREPLHATAMGKTLMAFNPEGPRVATRRLGVLDQYTARTRISHDDLLDDLSQIRRRGFALSDEERTEGVRAVAVPVFGADRGPVGAIGVQARSQRMNDELVRSLVPAMHHFASQVGRRLSDEHLVWP